MITLTADLLAREREVREYIERHAKTFGIDPNLVRGLITQESAFVAEAQSPTGAFGYGQFTGIGARQVQNIADMNEEAADLAEFEKRDASDPDKGIKAICATLWWLFNRKYAKVTDRKIQLEAVLTFYNGGGRPAAKVIQCGGHHEAIESLKALPSRVRSQSVHYAPGVAARFVAWHEHMSAEAPPPPARAKENPFDNATVSLDIRYRALVEALLLMDAEDDAVNSTVDVRDGMTEITLIFPGEYE